jgi:hypothetical protein
MAHCTSCEALKGQPADLDPHDQLSGDAHWLRDDGVIEAYNCRECGTKWRRFVVSKVSGAKSQYWASL